MSRVNGTYHNGTVILNRPVNWEEGTPVEVTSAIEDADEEDATCADGTPWPRTAEEIEAWEFKVMNDPLVFDTEEEISAFKTWLAESKAEQIELMRRQWEREDQLTK